MSRSGLVLFVEIILDQMKISYIPDIAPSIVHPPVCVFVSGDSVEF